ncbi:MAG TPA: C45 family peptidase [bacterium]
MDTVNRKRLFILIPLCAGSLSLSGCRKSFDPGNTASNEKATLESLKSEDDYPVYTMTYKGDYGFSKYLETGTMQASKSTPASTGWCCSCFAAFDSGGNGIFGRNFDWYDRATLVLFTDAPEAYASVSVVNLRFLGYSTNPDLGSMESRKDLMLSPYFSLDGLNEKGVAIGMMAIPSAEPPFDPAKTSIGELQVIRLVLDYASTVEEAVQLIGRYNVIMADPPIHYLIADKAGHSAVVEFVNGNMEVMRNAYSWQACTNFILAGSAALQDFQKASCWRYRMMCNTLVRNGGSLADEQGMQLLQQVSQIFENGGTMWSVVYGMSDGRVLFVPGRIYGSVMSFQSIPHE